MRERAVRWAPSAAVALFALVGAATSTQPWTVVLPCLLVMAGATSAMRSRGWPLLGPAVAVAVAVTVLLTGQPANVGWFAICLLAGWCAIQAGAAVALAFLAVAAALLIVQWSLEPADPGWAAWIAGTAFTTVTCLLTRRQFELLAELRLAQAGLAERSRVEERLRISRELHDVIAHSLTVSLLHVSSARLTVRDDPAEADAALAEAERLGRESLTEVRRTVGLMRGDAAVAPAPGAAQLADLVEGFRRAGVPIAWSVHGDLTGLGPTLGLTVYRILQEALTNAVRHGAGTEVDARIDVGREKVLLVVDNACVERSGGTGGTPGTGGMGGSGDTGGTGDTAGSGGRAGIGTDSMRERARAVGGSVEAGPDGDGWRVRAVLPRRAGAATASPALPW